MEDAHLLTARLCRQCGEEYPLSEFRLKRKGSERRETNCRNCHKANMKAWRRAKSQNALRRFVRRGPNQTLDRRLRGLAAAALQRFGGVQALANLMASEATAIHALRPGDPLPLQAVMTVLRLHELVESRQAEEVDEKQNSYDGLSVPQINARIGQRIIDLIRKEPEIAIAAAAAIGWTVIPPAEFLP